MCLITSVRWICRTISKKTDNVVVYHIPFWSLTCCSTLTCFVTSTRWKWRPAKHIAHVVVLLVNFLVANMLLATIKDGTALDGQTNERNGRKKDRKRTGNEEEDQRWKNEKGKGAKGARGNPGPGWRSPLP